MPPWQIVRHLWGFRDLIRQLVKRELGQRYQGSYLGFLWSFIVPLLMLLIYTFVFSVIFKSRWATTTEEARLGEFALTLFAGLAPFSVFSEVVNRAPNLILGVPNYVKKVVFPLEILPVVVLCASLFNSLISVGILLLGSLIFLGFISPAVVWLPLAYVPLALLCLGLGWLLASLG
ncbi:MAG: ABC transporter permease, partial [Anaerolineales bacterium]